MGILNLTQIVFQMEESLIKKTKVLFKPINLLSSGCSIIDIGGIN